MRINLESGLPVVIEQRTAAAEYDADVLSRREDHVFRLALRRNVAATAVPSWPISTLSPTFTSWMRNARARHERRLAAAAPHARAWSSNPFGTR